MRIRGSGNAVAIALAGLAVALAATGTAYAVTASVVHIADPAVPTRVAHVDRAGRLTTVGATSGIDVVTNFGFDATSAVTSPTTGTLAITSIAWSNPGLNSAFTGTTYNVNLVKIHAGTTGQCVVGQDGAYIERYLGGRLLDPGDDTEIAYPSPLLVKPTSSAKYCLGIATSHLGGAQSTLYLSTFQLTAYTASGAYSGLGLGATSRVTQATTKPVTR